MIDPNNELSTDALLNVLALSANATSVYVSQDLHIQFANDAMLQLWGKGRNVVGKPLLQAVPELAGQPFIELMQNVWHTTKTYIGTEIPSILNIDGIPTTAYFDFEYRAIVNKAGKTYCLLHIAADVTDRVTYKRLVKEKEEREQQLNEKLNVTNGELHSTNEEHTVTNEELQALNEELTVTGEELNSLNDEHLLLNEELSVTNEELKSLNDEYLALNEQLSIINTERETLNKALEQSNQELQSLNEEYLTTNEQLNILNGEHESLNEELAVTNKELLSANEELAVINEEQQSLNEELTVTSEELQSLNAEYEVLNEELKATNDELHSLNDAYITLNDKVTLALETAELAKNAANLGTFDLDVVNDKLEWDERCKELFGLNPSVEVTYSVDFVKGLHAEDKNRVLKAVADAYDLPLSRGNYDVEYRTVGAEDKKLRWVRAIGKVLFNPAKQPIRFIGTVMDITEQKEDEQRKNDFIGMVSHELKTPLTSLSAYLQVLLGKAKKAGDAFTLNALDKSFSQVKKMTTMINGFLNTSHLESGKIQIDKQGFDMAGLVRDVQEENTAITSHKLIFAPVERTVITADKDKIGQVISNFISNAVKYSPLDSDIHILCTTKDDHIHVSVKDEGMGIAPHHVEKLFERYYRIESDKTKSISGFGLGLYLCAEIIKRHGGNIGVQSEVGKSSDFWFDLPLAQKESATIPHSVK